MAVEPESDPAGAGAPGAPVKLGEAVPLHWLTDAGQDDLADRLDRRLADLEWFNDLVLANFEGPLWAHTENELAKYGMGVIGGWMYRSLIFERCQSKGMGGLVPLDRRFSSDEIEELTGETVAKSLHHFKVDVLMKGKWSHEGGASLRTYFIGQCLIRFANIYRRWYGNETRNRAHSTDDPVVRWRNRSPSEDPEQLAIDRLIAEEALSAVKDPRVRKAMWLTFAGKSQAEIAIELQVTEKAVERMLGNQRKRFGETG